MQAAHRIGLAATHQAYQNISAWLRTGALLITLGCSIAVGYGGQVVIAGLGLAITTSVWGQSNSGNAIAELLRLDNTAEPAPFLEVDQAFVARPEVINNDTVVVRWSIANGYYLYRNRFQFRINDRAVDIASVALPTGILKHDEYFGQSEVYYQQVLAWLGLPQTLTAAHPINLQVQYQGCADAGLCYPPTTKNFALSLPAATTGTGGDAAAVTIPSGDAAAVTIPNGGALSESDRLTELLLGGSLWAVALSFFGFGVLLAFTPCVLPMIPILSSIIIGQGGCSSIRAFGLSAIFVLVMAVTYTIAGVLAALFGANLSATLQAPWIILMVVTIFGLLSLSLFGFYELRIPVAWQQSLTAISNRQRGGTWIGVAAMGFLSALIVGPCISAPLAATLIVIGQIGNVALGAAALFALGIGMGAPLLLVGTAAGKLLLRTNPWMASIQAVFGVLLLGVAIVILERIVPGWITLLLWATLLIVSAIYMGALDAVADEVSGWRRLWKGVSLVMMVYGVILMLGAATGANNPLQPLQRLSIATGNNNEAYRLQFHAVKGLAGLQSALQPASAANRPVLLEYYADWCISCKELERNTFTDAAVQYALREVLLLRADVTANDVLDRTLLQAYGLYGPPAILFFDGDGNELRQHRVIGYVAADDFLRTIHQVTAKRAGTAQSAAVLRLP